MPTTFDPNWFQVVPILALIASLITAGIAQSKLKYTAQLKDALATEEKARAAAESLRDTFEKQGSLYHDQLQKAMETISQMTGELAREKARPDVNEIVSMIREEREANERRNSETVSLLKAELLGIGERYTAQGAAIAMQGEAMQRMADLMTEMVAWVKPPDAKVVRRARARKV